MPFRRFRIRALMIVVLLSALALAAFDRIGRLGPIDIDFKVLKEGSILFVPFLTLLALKTGLVIAMRVRRIGPDDPSASDSADNPVP